jgi:hypothetical protein
MDRLFYLGSEEMGRTSRERRGLKSNLAQGQKIGNCKLRGEWAELCFMARAAGMGLCVCKPYGDSAQYDVGIEEDGRMLRVQIKSTTYAAGMVRSPVMSLGEEGRGIRRGCWIFSRFILCR